MSEKSRLRVQVDIVCRHCGMSVEHANSCVQHMLTACPQQNPIDGVTVYADVGALAQAASDAWVYLGTLESNESRRLLRNALAAALKPFEWS